MEENKDLAKVLSKEAYMQIRLMEKRLWTGQIDVNNVKKERIDWIAALLYGAQSIKRMEELENENEKLRAALDNDGFRCDGCDIVEKAREALRENKELEQRLAQLERERDAAVADLGVEKSCTTCEHGDIYSSSRCEGNCRTCPKISCPCESCLYKWRGVCAENSKEG